MNVSTSGHTSAKYFLNRLTFSRLVAVIQPDFRRYGCHCQCCFFTAQWAIWDGEHFQIKRPTLARNECIRGQTNWAKLPTHPLPPLFQTKLMEPQWRPGPEPPACLTAAEIDPCLLTGNARQIVLPMDSSTTPALSLSLDFRLRQQCNFNHSVAIPAQHGIACTMPLCGCSIRGILCELTRAHISLSTEAYRWITMMLCVHVISPIVAVACLRVKWFNTSWRLKPYIIHTSQAVHSFQLLTLLTSCALLPYSFPLPLLQSSPIDGGHRWWGEFISNQPQAD